MAHKALVTRILEGVSRASHAQRRAAFDDAEHAEPLGTLIDKVAKHAHVEPGSEPAFRAGGQLRRGAGLQLGPSASWAERLPACSRYRRAGSCRMSASARSPSFLAMSSRTGPSTFSSSCMTCDPRRN